MIRFIYEPNEGMKDLIKTNIANYGEDVLYGVLEEASAYQLKSMSIYLVCEDMQTYGGHVYTNPLAVAAKNEFEASRIYYAEMEKNSSIMCVLEQNAAKAHVRPVMY